MHDRPTAVELVQAVKEHLEREVIPSIADHHLKFRTLVAAHVLSIVEREIRAGDGPEREELARLRSLTPDLTSAPDASLREELLARTKHLCAQIRRGAAGDPDRVRDHVRRTVLAKLAVANPAYRSVGTRVATP